MSPDLERAGRLPDRLYRRLVAWRTTILLAAAALFLVSLAGALRIRPRQDVLSLLTGVGGEGDRRAAEILVHFGALDVLFVDLSRAGATKKEIEAAGDELQKRLEASGLFHRVLFRLDPEALRRSFELLFARRFFLFDPPKDLIVPLEAAKRDLMSPASMMMEGLVNRDLLDHRSAMLDRLGALAPSMKLDTSGGTLMSEDGTHALLITEPIAKGLDVEAAKRVLERIRAEAPEGTTVEQIGVHLFSTSSAASIRRDVWTSVGSSIAAMLLLFAFYFRELRAVATVLVPVVVGAFVAAGIIGWLGYSLHGITFGFSAVMMGIGVDYGVLLYVSYNARRRRDPNQPPNVTMGTTFSRALGAITMGAATTVISFLVLLVSKTRVLEEFAVFTGIGITISFLVAVLVLPLVGALMASAREPSDRGGWIRSGILRLGADRPRLVLGTTLLLTPILALAATSVRFDGNVRNLDYQPDEIRAMEARFNARYDSPQHPTLVVVSGDSEEAALQKSDVVRDLLAAAKARGEIRSYSSPSEIIPAQATQRARLSRYDPARLRRDLEQLAPEREIAPGAFDRFFLDLENAKAGKIEPLRPKDLAGTPLETLLEHTLVRTGTRTDVLSVVHGSSGSGVQANTMLPTGLRDALTAHGATLVSGETLASHAVVAIKDLVARLSLFALFAIATLLLVYYRRPAPMLYALLPTMIGIAWTFGLMGLFSVPLNLISVGAFALVSGVGVDYGIFMTGAMLSGEPEELDRARASVTMAGLSTLVSFGSLLLAKSPVMWSLGFAVCAGVGVSLAGAIWMLPALWNVGGTALQVKRCGRCAAPLCQKGAFFYTIHLSVVAGLFILLGAAWLGGRRSVNGTQVLLVLFADLAYAFFLIRRQSKKPWSCKGCGAGDG